MIRLFTIFTLGLALVGSQAQPVNGLYQIISGDYSACCGIAGELRSALPNTDQAFFRLALDPQSNLPRMTFLNQQMQNVFSVNVCPPAGPVDFSFGYGMVLADSLFFHVDPGPYGLYWNYSVSNSASGLRIDGQVGIDASNCSDTPNHFTHSNLVAVLVPEPKMTVTDFSNGVPTIMIQGQTGRTNVLEASGDLVNWIPLSTNVMPNTDCAICPFVSFRDVEATNSFRRFYRSFEIY